uniref:type VI secretion system ATPase TssH n=1 Tax=uncultured Psychrobacter sp. TaxID=259303 RepID=UPI00259305ED|nr:type VI secretion system ATPase TssH [uncultured Psychrobacter sp.]
MSNISRSVLFAKLNDSLYKSLESAFTYCRLRENSYVELVHWLHVLVQTPDNDLDCINRYFEINSNNLKKDILAAVESLPTGASNVADFSRHVEEAVEQSWTYTSLLFDSQKIRSAYLLYTLLKSSELSNILFRISSQFKKINADKLVDDFDTIFESSSENVQQESPVSSNANVEDSEKTALAKYGSNLTEMAAAGKIDPIVGRDNEIRQIIDILMRRRQNNPILTGEAGVGKTAVVEALALKLASGDVPPSLKNVELILLDIGALKAGASVSGEFETRLRAVMEEVESSPTPIVLFIDEIHTLIGAGGSAGTGDAANLLKPALARGQLRTIGATTWAEYKKYFEKDPALTRRFQVINVDEPEEDEAIEMLRALVPSLESHHNVIILDEAIVSSVQLSHRYIPARKLPDKGIGLVDTACARVSLSQHSTPSRIEYLNRKIIALETQKHNMEREMKLDYDQQDKLSEIDSDIADLEAQLVELENKWQEESRLVHALIDVRQQILQYVTDEDVSDVEDQDATTEGSHTQVTDATVDSHNETALNDETDSNGAIAADNAHNDDDTNHLPNISDTSSDIEGLLETQKNIIEQLKQQQNDDPLVLPLVDSRAVANVVSDWTGIPVGKMMKDELQAILALSSTLSQRVIDQDHGMEAIARRVQTSRASLDDPNKPIGVFMLAGPSGVGKTETALALADSLYGGEHNVITINMSEYQEAHTVSTLKGAPPGYVGYGEGGVLTEAVRRKPYSVVLLDEVEKAHPDVHEIFFQVFDKGWMEDGEGRHIDFKNTIIILTTNVGTELIMNRCHNNDEVIDIETLQKELRAPMLQVFPAALLGRIQVIPYYPLNDAALNKIVDLQLKRIVKRIKDNHGITLSYSDDILALISDRCSEVESGGRMIDAILTNTILPKISKDLLTYIIDNKTINSIHLSTDEDDIIYRYL